MESPPPPYLFNATKDPAGGWHVYLACPGCGRWAELDADQIHGRVSTLCWYGCGFHETVDLFAHMPDPVKAVCPP